MSAPPARALTVGTIASIYVRWTSRIKGSFMTGKLLRYLLTNKATQTVLTRIVNLLNERQWDAELYFKAVFVSTPPREGWFFGGRRHPSPPIQVFVTAIAERLYHEHLRQLNTRYPDKAQRDEVAANDEISRLEARIRQAIHTARLHAHAMQRSRTYRDYPSVVSTHCSELDPLYLAVVPWFDSEALVPLQAAEWKARFTEAKKLLTERPGLLDRLRSYTNAAYSELARVSLSWTTSTIDTTTPKNFSF